MPVKEQTFHPLLILAVLFSVAAWAALALLGFGWYALLFAVFLWVANGILVARARSKAIEVDSHQFPALYKTLVETCASLNIAKVPHLYLLAHAGALNLFTIRHSCRSFIFLPPNVLDSYEADSREVRFLLGHELARLHTHGFFKLLLVLPSRFLPIIGNACSRADVFSCDRLGARAAGDQEASARAILWPSEASPSVDLAALTEQYAHNRDFFVSWHELTSAQPTRPDRVANLLGAARPAHPLAYPAALFTLGGFANGFSNLLFTVAIVVILAGVVRPALKAAKQEQEMVEAQNMRQERIRTAKEIMLTEGTIDPRLVGIWAGGSPAESATADYLRWTTARKKNGNLTTSYEQRAHGEEKKWNKQGQWRIFRGKYQEIYQGEEVREYEILKTETDSVKLSEDPQKPHAEIVEIRQPGDP